MPVLVVDCIAFTMKLYERRLELCALATHQTPVIAKTGFNSAPLRSLKPICGKTTHFIDDSFGVLIQKSVFVRIRFAESAADLRPLLLICFDVT